MAGALLMALVFGSPVAGTTASAAAAGTPQPRASRSCRSWRTCPATPSTVPAPTTVPTTAPTVPAATRAPTTVPTTAPTVPAATRVPTTVPTTVPTVPAATRVPTTAPTVAPTVTVAPTLAPTTVPTVVATAVATTVASSGAPTLVDTYENLLASGTVYNQTYYRPRQFQAGLTYEDVRWGSVTFADVGSYAGWDFFQTPDEGFQSIQSGPNWFRFRLNRPARVAVLVTDGKAPYTWLAGWTPGTSVRYSDGSVAPTFFKDFPAGTLTLGTSEGNGSPRETPLYLFAEQGGVPSRAPAVPAGKEVPQPNQPCPAWVHDQYTVTRDGMVHATWHRQIDPIYWCSFGHEHGSDPKLFGDGTWTPAFGVAAMAMGMAENHEGFKGALIEKDGYTWYLTLHFGTVNPVGGACNRYHEMGVAIARNSDKRLLADLVFMGDFGRAVENISQTPLTPDACPNQAQATGTGMRQHPVEGPGLAMYYPWRADPSGNVLGLIGTFSMNTADAINICGDLRCSTVVNKGTKGARRFFNPSPTMGVSARGAARTGVFYTDPLGMQFAPGATPSMGTVRQFLSPEADAHYAYLGDDSTCRTGPGYWNSFEAKYVCIADNSQGNSVELEGSLRSPN